MDGYRCVAKLGFRPGSSQLEWPVLHVIKRRGGIFIGHFDIGKTRAVEGTIIYQSFAPINKALAPHFLKRTISAFYDLIIKREGKLRPITAGAHRSDLAFKEAFIILDKIPYPAIKLVSGEVKTALPFRGQLFLINYLGFKACVVGSGQKERRPASHAVVSG